MQPTYRLQMALASPNEKVLLRQLLATSDAHGAKVVRAELLRGAEPVRLKAMPAEGLLLMIQLRAEGSRFPVNLGALIAAAESASERRLDLFYVFGFAHDGQVVVDILQETIVLCWSLPVDREMVAAANDPFRRSVAITG